MHSVRYKITAITIIAILLTVLAVVYTAFSTMGAESDKTSAEMMYLTCESTGKTLDDYLDGIEQSLDMAAYIAMDSLDSVALVEGGVAGTYAKSATRSPEQIKGLDAYLDQHCKKIQEFFGGMAAKNDGIVTYYYCINPEISTNVHGFFYSRAGKTGFVEQPPLDARELDPGDMEHTTWYYTPIQKGRPTWVGPYKAHFLGETVTLSYLTPIYKAGELIGVMGMDIFFDTLVSRISSLKVYNTGYACLYNEDGEVLYHPEFQIGDIPITDTGYQGQDIFRESNSEGKLIRYSMNGEERQMAFSTLSNGMKLVVTASVDEITSSWKRLSTMLLVVTAFFVCVFGVVVMLVMEIMVEPLQRLKAASERLAAGDYDAELDYDSQDEVGTLTKVFSQMRDHLQQYISDLNRRIRIDTLTGLFNKDWFYELAEKKRHDMEENGEHPAILFINLVGLKYYNRLYTLSGGNELICAVANILSEEFGYENCCRLAQDHFAVLSYEEGLESRLNTVFERCVTANEGRTLPVRAGIYLDRLDKVDISVACDRAKYACDQMRGTYVSCFNYFDEKMLNSADNYSYVVNNLDRALEEHWIRVYYQPIVRASTGRICDEEALSRWIDPIKGFMSPAEFIPVLEESRLIWKMDLYVLDQILLKIKEQKQEGFPVVPQSLNLSREDFDSCDIVEEVTKRVDGAGIPRRLVTIEITESVVGSDFDFIKQQILRFQELGFQVWMDDFGSGYSALEVLKDVKFDLIKFDMSFLKRFDEGEENRIILRNLLKMAMELGSETLLEGCETKEQIDFLKEMGCMKLQGYYFSKPIPKDVLFNGQRDGSLPEFENREEH